MSKGSTTYRSPVDEEEEVSTYTDDSGASDTTFNLSEVDEKQVFAAMPIGVYPAKVESVVYGKSQKNNRMFTWAFQTTDPNTKQRRKLFFYVVDNGDQTQFLARLKRTILRIDPHYDVTAVSPANLSADLIGMDCMIRVGQQDYKGEMRNQVKDVLPAEDEGSGFLDEDE